MLPMGKSGEGAYTQADRSVEQHANAFREDDVDNEWIWGRVGEYSGQGRRSRFGWSGQNRTTFFIIWIGNGH